MNDPATPFDELLVDAALGQLATDDANAFTALLERADARAELDALERTAALVGYATAPLPSPTAAESAVLLSRLHDDARAFFAGLERAERRRRPFAPLPWLLAAAAVLPWAWPRTAATERDPGLDRAALLGSGQPVVQCAWQPGPSERRGEVHGDVVWDAVGQRGFLRLSGLPTLPRHQRYQLWIVDASRQGPPVDGGLLPNADDSHAEVVIPVQARLPVQQAAAFVLTIEDEHGAVVSAQQHVVAIARP